MSALLVAIGGAAGFGAALLDVRRGATRPCRRRATWSVFPLGTLAVNVLGCLVVGALAEIGERRGPLTTETRALLMVGFLGGFTTFSAFANETVAVWRSGATAVSMVNVVVSVVLCVAAVVVGRGLIAAVVK